MLGNLCSADVKSIWTEEISATKITKNIAEIPNFESENKQNRQICI